MGVGVSLSGRVSPSMFSTCVGHPSPVLGTFARCAFLSDIFLRLESVFDLVSPRRKSRDELRGGARYLIRLYSTARRLNSAAKTSGSKTKRCGPTLVMCLSLGSVRLLVCCLADTDSEMCSRSRALIIGRLVEPM